MTDWMDLDLDSTIRDFEYTKRAAQKMNRIMDSEEFADMDADTIFRYLVGEMEIVMFSDYLKRYLYEVAEIDIPFKNVGNEIYQEIMVNSFLENHAPHSFVPTTKRLAATVKGWLNQNSVRRNTIFLLGFGLRMPVEDVSGFLTKVIREENFDFDDPREVIFWYCYQNGLHYQRAAQLQAEYVQMKPVELSEKFWIAIRQDPANQLLTEYNLKAYLAGLKYKDIPNQKAKTAWQEFMKLYETSRQVTADLYNATPLEEAGGKVYTAEDIQPADVAGVLCSGIPVNDQGNQQKVNSSLLSAQFQNKCMNRQRIGKLLSGNVPVERFDLITLLFYIYACTVEPDWPAERYLQYVDAVNELLGKCGMTGIYPVNPYETFILMCIVTDSPLDVYAEIWEKSYEE